MTGLAPLGAVSPRFYSLKFDNRLIKILTGKPIGKRYLGKPRCRREDNIRMDLKVNGINTRNCVDSVQNKNCWRALVNAALNFRLP